MSCLLVPFECIPGLDLNIIWVIVVSPFSGDAYLDHAAHEFLCVLKHAN